MRPELPMRPDLPPCGRRISELTRARLSPAITAILEGRLRFRRRKQVWEVEGVISTFEPRRRRTTATS
jgi:hypothetical protein